MIPLRFNKIRAHIEKHEEIEMKNETFKSISRMAFEKNKKNQIIVDQLDYNTLETYRGPLLFIEGCQKIYF